MKAEPIEILDDDCEELTDTRASDDRTEYDGPHDNTDFTEEKFGQQDEEPNSLWGSLPSDANDLYGQVCLFQLCAELFHQVFYIIEWILFVNELWRKFL